MKRLLFFLFFTSSLLAQQSLRSPQDSTRVPSNSEAFGNADIANKLGVLSERTAAMKDSLDRIEREQNQIKLDLQGIHSEQIAAKSRAEGRRDAAEESLQSATLLSRVLMPIIAAAITSGIALWIALRSIKRSTEAAQASRPNPRSRPPSRE